MLYIIYIEMSAFDGKYKKETRYTTGFKLVNNELMIDDIYLTNHIRSTFSDLYINGYLRFMRIVFMK